MVEAPSGTSVVNRSPGALRWGRWTAVPILIRRVRPAIAAAISRGWETLPRNGTPPVHTASHPVSSAQTISLNVAA